MTASAAGADSPGAPGGESRERAVGLRAGVDHRGLGRGPSLLRASLGVGTDPIGVGPRLCGHALGVLASAAADLLGGGIGLSNQSAHPTGELLVRIDAGPLVGADGRLGLLTRL